MTWEYRIMRTVGGKGSTHWYSYGIHEFFSPEKRGAAGSWTKEPMSPGGESIEELRSDYEFMGKAFDKPILDYHTGKKVKK